MKQRLEDANALGYPFDRSGVIRGKAGFLCYEVLPSNTVAMLRDVVLQGEDRPAVAALGGESLSYAELWQRAAIVAGGLRAEGLNPGDRVMIELENGVDWVVAYLAVLLARCVVVPINIRLAGPEVDYIRENSGASYSFQPGRTMPHGEPLIDDTAGLEDITGIYYTSGTTGRPKGVMISHANLLSNCENLKRDMQIQGDDFHSLCCLPLFHIAASACQLLLSLYVGGSVLIMRAFKAADFIDELCRPEINSVVGVSSIYFLMLKQADIAQRDFSHIRWGLYGGVATSPELVKRLVELFPNALLSNTFGMTEACGNILFLPHAQTLTNPGSVGFPSPSVEIRFDELNLETGIGELLIRGQNVSRGYWQNEAATREAIVDGWLHTGDLLRIDGRGLAYAVDRKKDMINRGGENVYPAEIEHVLNEHPDVADVAVIGVPDPVMVEKVGAVVIAKPGHEVSAESIRLFAAQNLADFKVPQYVLVRTSALPRNASGKVQKHLLRDDVAWGDPLF